ncbi:hypothetical protein CcaverHIS002_0305490 [Cutaneotrichosporon cavernicola]|uniref:Something about silencing protein 4 domain-containing protein n=1 Tax=Cutaneotrichosporon cavernicola TaxID=279322 RepID=A0AA48I9T6_9TREE|nr:uncharacterized protein CcaverHIS019_0305450 [Cutaneotrichosporon cavernicola]BEI82681.1 hypothetical protein CcaverHIS002_0305490 [Cutaneotrichosporon cavernicola]BEI90475.1 hypothetical protein CcaverHIS019_0305450 [Cutaneotrichosporon cavernicola]
MPPRGSPRVGASTSASARTTAGDALGPSARLTLRPRGLSDNASSDVSAASSPLTPTSEANDEKKGKAPERRVLPARIRRAAGGAEGIRELEEMVVDWLERYADRSSCPPKTLQITLATLPCALITPKPYTIAIKAKAKIEPADPIPPQREAGPSRPRIETPSWVFVRAGEDDREEAREELAAARAHVPHSPAKRLRGGLVGHEIGEDTSDAYYEKQHRKFEVFERRQRIRERETLSFERYKMRSRVDHLRALAVPQWAAVVGGVLSRPDGGWDRGRAKLAAEGADWLRRRLIREGRELLNRYDQLLPNTAESKKPRFLDPPDSPPRQKEKKRGPSRLHSVNPETSPRKRAHTTPEPDPDTDSSLSDPPSPTPPPTPPRKKIILRLPARSSLTPQPSPTSSGRKPPKDRSAQPPPPPRIRLRAQSGLVQTKLTFAPLGAPRPPDRTNPGPDRKPEIAQVDRKPVDLDRKTQVPGNESAAWRSLPSQHSPPARWRDPHLPDAPVPSLGPAQITPWTAAHDAARPVAAHAAATPAAAHAATAQAAPHTPTPFPPHNLPPPLATPTLPPTSPVSPSFPKPVWTPHTPAAAHPPAAPQTSPRPPVNRWWTPQGIPQSAPLAPRLPPDLTTPTIPMSVLEKAARKRELEVDNGKKKRVRAFGMPVPPSVERKSEFELPDNEYRPILAKRRQSEEMDMEGVEEAVV